MAHEFRYVQSGDCSIRAAVEGEGPLVVGRGPVRTGVTAIVPRGVDDLGRLRRPGARIEPQPHRIVARTVDQDVADPIQAQQLVTDLQ